MGWENLCSKALGSFRYIPRCVALDRALLEETALIFAGSMLAYILSNRIQEFSIPTSSTAAVLYWG